MDQVIAQENTIFDAGHSEFMRLVLETSKEIQMEGHKYLVKLLPKSRRQYQY